MVNGRTDNGTDAVAMRGVGGVDTAALGQGIDDLIAQARSGSTAALGRILEGCRNYLLLSARRSLDSDLRPKGGASDFVQETFLEAYKDFSSFRGTTEQELLGWLTAILNNRLSNNVRHYRHTLKREVDREIPLEFIAPCIGSNQEVAPTDESFLNIGNAERLQAAMSRLPDAMREVLILRTWDRRSFVDIAARLQGTPDSVRKLWMRAVQRLRTEFQKQS